MYKINGHKILQYPGELERLIAIFRDNNVRSYLEVGCKYGGSLWEIACALPKGSRIVAIDLMQYQDQTTHLRNSANDLTARGYDVTLLPGDSTDPKKVETIRPLGPFDACLIDANHTLPYVTKDWENYGPMCRIVAFHDINWYRPPDWPANHPDRKYQIDVPQFWNGLKGGYRHVEIKLDKQDNGIGVLWR